MLTGSRATSAGYPSTEPETQALRVDELRPSTARGIGRRLAGRLPIHAEGGFTLVELLVAIFVSVTGLLAVAGTLDGSRELVSVSERKEAVAHQGERAIENLLALPDASLALKTVPPHNPQPNDPDHYVANGTPATYQWDNGNASVVSERFAQLATGLVDTTTSWTDGRLSGKVHRYVTCVDDASANAPSTPAGCPLGLGLDYKRVTVAVTVEGSAPKKPTLFSSLVTPPS